ncbi:MAG: Ig-like domain-containing protein [Clostridia bacterium]|nr:Ig-like domain-containing protein [Clostridia bacterium]
MRTKNSRLALLWALLFCVAFPNPAIASQSTPGGVVVSNTITPMFDESPDPFYAVSVDGEGKSLPGDPVLPADGAADQLAALYVGDENHTAVAPLPGSSSVSVQTYQATVVLDCMERADGGMDLIAVVTGNMPDRTPQGMVLFQGIGVPDDAFAIVGGDGIAVYNWVLIPYGEYVIHAEYRGDEHYPGLTSDAQTVRNLPAVSIMSTAGVPESGLLMTMSIQRFESEAPEPTGTVAFVLDDAVVEEVTLVDGKASHLFVTPVAGGQRAAAVYSGDINYFPREETASIGEDYLTRREPEKSRSSLFVAATAGSGDGPATLTATVTGRGGEFPTGQVIFSKDKEFLGVRELYRGEAVFSWADAPQGSHTIYAEYRGDERYLGETAVTVFRKNGVIAPLTPQMMRQNPQYIILRDKNGKNLMIYDTTLLPIRKGVMALDAKQRESFYSYGFNLGHLRDLSHGQQDGCFDIQTPVFTLRMPFGLVPQMRDLVEYVIDRDLRPSELELRLEVTAVGKNDAIAALYREQVDNAENTNLVQVNLKLYTLDNEQLDFTTTMLDTPIELSLPEGGRTQIARYDKVLRRFIPIELVDDENMTTVTVNQLGVYRLVKIMPPTNDILIIKLDIREPLFPHDLRSRYFVP